MAGNFTEVEQYDATVPKATDGEDVTAVLLNSTWQALVNRTKWLKKQVSGSVVRLRYSELTGRVILETAAIPASTTSPTTSQGGLLFALQASARNAASTIKCSGIINITSSVGNYAATITMFRDETCIGVFMTPISGQYLNFAIPIHAEFPAGDTSPHTYSVRVGDNGGNPQLINGNSLVYYGDKMRSTLAVEEILP